MSYSDKLKDPRWQKVIGIYKLIINDRFYIGSAVNLSKRLRQHFNELKRNRHCNIHLQRAFNKYKSLDFEIIEIILLPDILISREQYYIDKLKPHYNISPTAGSQFGFRHSEESKKLISRVQIGRIVSDEARRNYSIAKKGIKCSDAHRKNISIAKMGDKNPFYKAGINHPQYGTHRKPETIIKLSKDNNRFSKTGIIYDVETGNNYVFRSLRSMCKNLGLTYRGVLSALRKERFYKDRYYANFVHVPKGCETILIKSNG